MSIPRQRRYPMRPLAPTTRPTKDDHTFVRWVWRGAWVPLFHDFVYPASSYAPKGPQ